MVFYLKVSLFEHINLFHAHEYLEKIEKYFDKIGIIDNQIFKIVRLLNYWIIRKSSGINLLSPHIGERFGINGNNLLLAKCYRQWIELSKSNRNNPHTNLCSTIFSNMLIREVVCCFHRNPFPLIGPFSIISSMPFVLICCPRNLNCLFSF